MVTKNLFINKYFDQHVHNYYSVDSNESILKYVEKAIESGIPMITFTNHLDFDYGTNKETWFFDVNKEKEELCSLNKQYKNLFLSSGIEIGYSKNHISEINEIINSYKFNVINLSMHFYNGIDFYDKNDFIKNGVANTLKIYFKEVIRMLETFTNYDVLSHIDYAFKTAYNIDSSLSIKDYENQLIKILKLVIKNNKTLEVNTKVQDSITDTNHLPYLLSLYKSLGGKNITLSSDAHKAERLCCSFDKYLDLLKKNGFTYLIYFIDRKPNKFYII